MDQVLQDLKRSYDTIYMPAEKAAQAEYFNSCGKAWEAALAAKEPNATQLHKEAVKATEEAKQAASAAYMAAITQVAKVRSAISEAQEALDAEYYG